jgi:hypothetical protein
MEYNSFYGGRRGASFIIIKQYPDIPTMTKDFRQGGLFTTVNYDEYVIINCVNKNHPDNGKIFRRGYDYNSGRTITAWQAYDKNTGKILIKNLSNKFGSLVFLKSAIDVNNEPIQIQTGKILIKAQIIKMKDFNVIKKTQKTKYPLPSKY